MTRLYRSLQLIACFLVFAAHPLVFAEEPEDPVKVEMISDEASFSPGRPFWVAFDVKLEKDWHISFEKASGQNFSVQWHLPEGFTASALSFPKPKPFQVEAVEGVGFEKEFFVLAKITPPENAAAEKHAKISADISFVACSSEMCLPGSLSTSLSVPLSLNEPLKSEYHQKFLAVLEGPESREIAFAGEAGSHLAAQASSLEFTGGIGAALVLAFVGGLILNLMPCVLPVISFKIMSFVKMAGQDKKETLKHGLVFAIGVLVSFWILGGVLLALQAYGHAVGWGFQLQEPVFVGVLAAVLLVFSLSLFGLFEVGASVTGYAGAAGSSSKEGMTSSFLSGVLATAVATPCTGPFLGSAIGFAVTLPAYFSLPIFTSLGVGMALPYILLAAFPRLLRFLPKPGPWMVTFKEVMGFVMLATVLWLVWVFGAQTSSLAVLFLLGGFFILAIGCWIYGKWASFEKSRKTRKIAFACTLFCLLFGGYAIWKGSSLGGPSHGELALADGWEAYSPERVKELQANGTPVFVDFTAKWCLICQTNHMVLTNESVSKKFEELGVVRMKADWTRSDPVITRELKKLGRSGVPLYLIYNGSETPTILPQVLTSDVVLEHLSNI